MKLINLFKRKRKVARGESGESSINWFLLVVVLAISTLLCFLVYALASPYLFESEQQVTILPFSTVTSAPLPTLTPAIVQPVLTAAPTLTSPPTIAGQSPITTGTALQVALVANLTGHSNAVSSVAFSPNGALLASGSLDGSVRVWNVSSGVVLMTFQSASNRVDSVAFSADGTLVAAGGQDTLVRLWDVRSGQESILPGPTGAVTSVAFSPVGALIAAGSDDGHVYLWDSATPALLATLQGHTSYVTSVAFSPDGTLLASGSEDDTVRLWDVANEAPLGVLRGHASNVTGVVFSPDGVLLASASTDRAVRLWDVATRSEGAILTGHAENVNSVTFNRDGRLVISGAGGIDDDTVRLWDTRTGAQMRILRPEGPVYAVAISPDGTLLATGGATFLSLWGVTSGASATGLPGPTAAPALTMLPTLTLPAGPVAATQTLAVDEDTCVVTALYDEINLRSGPGLGYDALATMAVDQTAIADGWASDVEGFTWWRLTDGSWVRADTVSWPDICWALPLVTP